MNMKKLLSVILLFVLVVNSYAQNETDAFRYSNINFFGTSRFNAMGGAFTALGGDFSSISLNPGAMGVYRSSEIVFTPAFDFNYTNSSVKGISSNDSKLNVNISNISYLGNFNASSHDIISWSFAFGYNRLANFNNEYSVNITSESPSLLQSYINDLNVGNGTYEGDIPDLYPFDINLAYQNYLINPLATDTLHYSHEMANATSIDKYKNVSTRGGIGETFFGYGANLNDVLFFGATVGFPKIRYIEKSVYQESNNDTSVTVKSFTKNDYLKTTGNGINFKLGIIYRATDWFRFGLALHSSTYYSMHDTWDSNMSAEFKDNRSYSYSSPIGLYDYNLRTPYRVEAGVGFIIAQNGALSIDYEYVDYTVAKFNPSSNSPDGYSFVEENKNIDLLYKPVHNIRAGFEWKLTEELRIQLGYRWYDNPYVFAKNPNQQILSGGFGYKTDEFYVNLGYFYQNQQQQTLLHYGSQEVINNNLSNQNVSVSFGVRF
jgi:hypothetical protein